jgi:hypothetical protein
MKVPSKAVRATSAIRSAAEMRVSQYDWRAGAVKPRPRAAAVDIISIEGIPSGERKSEPSRRMPSGFLSRSSSPFSADPVNENRPQNVRQCAGIKRKERYWLGD